MGRMNKNKEQEMDGGTYIGKKVGNRIRNEKWRDVGKKEGRRKKVTRHGEKCMEEEYEQEIEGWGNIERHREEGRKEQGMGKNVRKRNMNKKWRDVYGVR